jgi:hypothetical protein
MKPVLVLAVLAVSLCASCDNPTPLTREEAAAILERERFSEPIHVTYLNPMTATGCNDLTLYLRNCQDEGLVGIEWLDHTPPCGNFTVELTDKGREYFSGLQYSGMREALYTTKGWEVTLLEPIVPRLPEVHRIKNAKDGQQVAHFTVEYDFPPALRDCTRHSQRKPQEGEASFRWSGGRWNLQ